MSDSGRFELHPQLKKDSYLLGQFTLSQLLLINDRQFPWFVLVPRRNQIQEIYQLLETDQLQLWRESAQLSQVVMDIYTGDKLNVATIGNMVPQLHMHHVVRFKQDPCWPAPIWGKLPMVSYEQDEALVIQQQLASKLTSFETLPF